MKRGTTYEKTNALLDKFREKVPDMAIRTTLIVGFREKRKKSSKLKKIGFIRNVLIGWVVLPILMKKIQVLMC